ncbi:hypothetical protein PGB90_001996 [Kerria lacca]
MSRLLKMKNSECGCKLKIGKESSNIIILDFKNRRISIENVLFVFEGRLDLKRWNILYRPPSSSLSYGGHGNDDVRSPGSGGTPGPLSQPPSSQALDHNDPGDISVD